MRYSQPHNRTHFKRDNYIRANCKDVWKPYLRLKNESEKARYMEPVIFSLTSAQVKAQLLEDQYPKVKEAAHRHRV